MRKSGSYAGNKNRVQTKSGSSAFSAAIVVDNRNWSGGLVPFTAVIVDNGAEAMQRVIECQLCV